VSDPLSELLRVAGVRGSLISRAALTPPYGVSCPPQPRAIFHVPAWGTAWVRAGDSAVQLGPGDVAVLPRGAAHIVSDQRIRAPPPIDRWPRRHEPGELPCLHDERPEPDLDLLCGAYRLGAPADRWITDAMPELMVVRGSASTEAYLHATVQLLRGEVATGGPGATIVSDRLVEVLVVHIVRGWARAAPGDHPGWLAGIADPHMGPLLAEIHRRPAEPWSLHDMARAAGLSRTRFVERFTRRVGCSPGSWLTEWRMSVAQRMLRHGASVSEAAEAAGYASEASFTRAFKRVAGATPTAWRAQSA